MPATGQERWRALFGMFEPTGSDLVAKLQEYVVATCPPLRHRLRLTVVRVRQETPKAARKAYSGPCGPTLACFGPCRGAEHAVVSVVHVVESGGGLSDAGRRDRRCARVWLKRWSEAQFAKPCGSDGGHTVVRRAVRIRLARVS